MRVRLGIPALLVLIVIVAAASPAAAATSQRPTTQGYQVRPGDTLWTLARRFGTTADQLARTNGISTEAILSIGQRLKVPARAASRSVAPDARIAGARLAPAAPSGSLTAVYHVRAGDTLWVLARRHGMTPERLAAMNGVSAGAILSIGQRLRVPAPPAPVGPRTAAPAVEAPAAPEVSTPNAQAGTPAPPRVSVLPSRGAKWSSTIVALSIRFLGVPYRWGGTAPDGFDCSGFMYYVFQRTGVAVPRTTYDMYDAGTPVPSDQLQAGDFVFFQTLQPGASHAGIYVGDGRFIHSSSGFGRVTITPMNHRYYAPRYLGARRF